jgi:hypothetical protein
MDTVIAKSTPEEMLTGCRRALGLAEIVDSVIDDVLLAALLRRSAGIQCPCSSSTLRVSLLESLRYLSPDESSLSERLDSMIESLIAGGDLLELADVATDDPAVKGTWLFAAPPSFVVRPSGSVFLLGIVRDQDMFLPESLASRIVFEGFTRTILPKPGEDLRGELRQQGLQDLSENLWLKSPKVQTAQDILKGMEQRLTIQPPSGTIKDLQILDPTQPVRYYPGRWMAPTRHSGTFIARRPQEYGAPIWCFVSLQAGVPVRLLDLPLNKTRWRGCDVAWHLQMAIDCCHHNPQVYRRRQTGIGARLDFFSPLPKWAQRRLMILGRPLPREDSLMSYWLPDSEASTEERFLQERLWLSRTQESI